MRPPKKEERRETIYKIDKIEYSIWSPEEIKAIAVAKITRSELYDVDGNPVEGGLLDLRLGVTEPGLKCKTCGKGVDKCLGHWGYLELAKPVYHVTYLKYLAEVFKAVCFECGRVTLTEEEKKKFLEKAREAKEKYGEDAYWDVLARAFKEAKKKKECPHCKAKKPKIELRKVPFFIFKDGEQLLPDKAREVLEKIPDEDLPFIGMDPKKNRPEWLILTILPIPPVTIRPSITLETGLKTEDDLTHKLGDIVRVNQNLKDFINSGSPMTTILDYWQLLQYHIATYIDNRPLGKWVPARHRSGKLLKTLTQRIAGKEGIIRKNLTGKRVNYSARATIIPDPFIKINEIGVPIEIAKELTYPLVVTEFNIEYAKEFIRNNDYPGANYIVDENGVRRKILPTNRDALLEELKPGWIIERHMLEGDYVLFHRYPSLHRMNTLAHKVRILPGKVFRMNPAATTPYNADFDGDEMDISFPQIETAMAELRYLMDLKYHIVTPRYGLPIVGAKQDFIMGNFLLTNTEKLTKEEVMFIVGFVGIELEESKEIWNGKEVYSLILPKIDYEGDTTLYKHTEKEEYKLIIKDGKIVQGVIDDKAIGTEKGRLLRKIVDLFGEDYALEFLHNSNLMALAVLELKGISISFEDLDLPEEVIKEKEKIIKEALEEVNKVIEKYEKDELELIPGKNKEETLRTYINNILNSIRSKLGELVIKSIDIRRNNIAKIALSGSRGNIMNLVLILTSLGQQAIRGEPINRGYKKRVLPHFKENTKDPKANGFVISSYRDGLDPIEFFMHSAASRSNLMDKTLATPKSGYFYRRMVNASYDVKVEYDNTVRDENSVIIQFEYGEDGIDVSKSYHGEFDLDSIFDFVIEKIKRKNETRRSKENTS